MKYPCTSIALAVTLMVLPTFAEEENTPRPKTVRGKVEKVAKDSLTVYRSGGDRGGKISEVFQVDKKTKIRLETAETVQVKIRDEDGERLVDRPKTINGTLAELNANQRVSVTYDVNKVAIQIIGHRPPLPRKREGE